MMETDLRILFACIQFIKLSVCIRMYWFWLIDLLRLFSLFAYCFYAHLLNVWPPNGSSIMSFRLLLFFCEWFFFSLLIMTILFYHLLIIVVDIFIYHFITILYNFFFIIILSFIRLFFCQFSFFISWFDKF